MIHVGEKVKITDTGKIYSSYPGFLDYYRETACADMIDRVCSQYVLNGSPTRAETRDKVFTVMFVREHGSLDGRKLALINDGTVTYIIGVEGLSVVFTDLPFTEGDKVYIANRNYNYSIWEELIKNMSTVIPDGAEVYRKWTRSQEPSDDEENGKSPKGIFTVKWIGRHISRPEEDVLVIISNDTHSYIMGVKGLAKAGEKSWDKYIIYVRNWAVMNKDSAQSVRDATGPKPYAEWVRNKS